MKALDAQGTSPPHFNVFYNNMTVYETRIQNSKNRIFYIHIAQTQKLYKIDVKGYVTFIAKIDVLLHICCATNFSEKNQSHSQVSIFYYRNDGFEILME